MGGNVWGKAALSLEEIRQKELRVADYYQERNKNLNNEILQYVFEHSRIRECQRAGRPVEIIYPVSQKSSSRVVNDQTRYSDSHERSYLEEA